MTTGLPVLEFDFTIVGAVSAQHAATTEPARLGDQAKLLLARLLVEPMSLVTTDALAVALWGEEDRASRRNGVQQAVRSARRALGDTVEPRRLIVLAGDAYRIVVGNALMIDSGRLWALATLGHDRAVKQPRSARAMLDEALSITGRLLGEFADRPWAAGYAEELDRMRERARFDLNEVRLALGEHADLVEPLRSQIIEHPYHEPLRGQLIRALLGAGRATEASLAFREAIADLGAVGPELRRLGQQVGRGARDVRGSPPAARTEARGDIVLCAQLDLGDRAIRDPAVGTLCLLIDTNGGVPLPVDAGRLIATFEDADTALDAARAIASDFRLAPRVGVHGGPVIDLGGRLIGPGPALCWHLVAAAHPGQTLVSADARDRLRQAHDLHDLGAHRFSDLGPGAPLFELVHPRGLRFAPPETLDRRPHNLPVQPTRFVGREEELVRLSRLIGRGTLLTLTGPGGCGKTRLALQLAARNVGAFADGAWFVGLGELEPGSGIELVAAAIANQLAVRALREETIAAAVARQLADRALLLVIDNCEQVSESVAALMAQLHARCPAVCLIATSRWRLDIDGETTHAVQPMSLDADGPDELSEAVELLLERAGPLAPDEAQRAGMLTDAASICRGFAGLPLAIELAAGQVATRGVAGVAAEVVAIMEGDGPLGRYANHDQLRPARQRTIESAIEWSYRLLDKRERAVLRCLAVFRGSFGETQARALVERSLGPTPQGAATVPEMLANLVECSVVVAAAPLAGASRMRLLEPIRAFAQQLLKEEGELPAARDGHAAIYHDLAVDTAPGLFGPAEQLCLERLEADHDNLRAALSWYVAAGRSAEALGLVGALWWLWFSHGHLEEGGSCVARALKLDEAPTRARVRALRAGSHLAWWRGDFDGCRAYNLELQRCAAAICDAWGLSWAQMAFGAVEMFHDPLRALGRFEQSRRGFEELDREWEAGYACQVTGGARWFGGDEQAAGEAYEQAVEIFERLGHRSVLASARRGAGLMAARGGHAARGAAMCEQALQLSDAIGDRAGSAQALNFLASISRDNADYATAVARYRDALSLAHQVGELWATCWALDGLGGVACAVGDPEIAASLLAHSGRLASRAGYNPPPHERRLREDDIAILRRTLGEDAFERASTEGALMSVGVAVTVAAAFAARHA